jgi:hypothetical protein
VDRQNPQTIARVFGWLFIATFVTSIPAYFIFYAPVRDDPGLITGTGADPTASVALGAALEVFLIIANVGTAVVVYPILKRQSEIGATSLCLSSSRREHFHRHRDHQPPHVLVHATAGHDGRPSRRGVRRDL